MQGVVRSGINTHTYIINTHTYIINTHTYIINTHTYIIKCLALPHVGKVVACVHV